MKWIVLLLSLFLITSVSALIPVNSSNVPISFSPDETYILTEDVTTTFQILSSNVILDGNGFTVDCNGGYCIDVDCTGTTLENITVKNLIFSNSDTCISIYTGGGSNFVRNFSLFNSLVTGCGFSGLDVSGSDAVIGMYLENNTFDLDQGVGTTIIATTVELKDNSFGNSTVGISFNDGDDLLTETVVNVTFEDNQISHYGLGDAVPKFKRTGFATLEYLESLNATGSNLSNDVIIDENYIFVDTASSSGLNKPARLTFENLPANLTNRFMVAGNAECIGICTNLTSLDGSTVIFDVSNFDLFLFLLGGDILTPVFTPVTTSAIYQNLAEGGAGLAIFLHYLGLGLFFFLIMMALVGIIYAICTAFTDSFIPWFLGSAK